VYRGNWSKNDTEKEGRRREGGGDLFVQAHDSGEALDKTVRGDSSEVEAEGIEDRNLHLEHLGGGVGAISNVNKVFDLGRKDFLVL